MLNSCQWAYEWKKYVASFAIRAVVPQHMKLFHGEIRTHWTSGLVIRADTATLQVL